jgi:hypothetical protein
MAKIIVRQGNPLDLKAKYIQSFLEDLKKEFSKKGIRVELDEVEPTNYGTTLWEVLRVYLNEIPHEFHEHIVDYIMGAAGKWVLERFKTIWHRPKSISVIDENGQQIAYREFQAKKAEEMVDEWEYFYKVIYKKLNEGESTPQVFFTLGKKPISKVLMKQLIEAKLATDGSTPTISIITKDKISRKEYKANTGNDKKKKPRAKNSGGLTKIKKRKKKN